MTNRRQQRVEILHYCLSAKCLVLIILDIISWPVPVTNVQVLTASLEFRDVTAIRHAIVRQVCEGDILRLSIPPFT